MIAVQNVETPAQPRFRRQKNREIVGVLDMVVPFEVGQQIVKSGSKPAGKGARLEILLSQHRDAAAQMRRQFAKEVMALEPEPAHGGQRARSPPLVARITLTQELEIFR